MAEKTRQRAKPRTEMEIFKSLIRDRATAPTEDIKDIFTEVFFAHIIYKFKLLSVSKGENESVNYSRLKYKDGSTYFGVYTDDYELRHNKLIGKNFETTKKTFSQYANKVMKDESYDGIVINPFSLNKFLITREVLNKYKNKIRNSL